MGSFSDSVKRFTDKTEMKMDLAVRKISLEVFSRVILRSPVDTGRFRGNWQVSIGQVPEGVVEIDDKTGSATISKATAETTGARAGDVIYLANNLPYAVPLEEGHSGQAPQGMVSLTVQEFKKIASQIGLELSKV